MPTNNGIELIRMPDRTQMTQLDQFMLARFLYGLGIEWLSDSEYDALEKHLRRQYPDNPYIHKGWMNDPVPHEALWSSGMDEQDIHMLANRVTTEADTVHGDELTEQCSEIGTKSILGLFDPYECYQHFEAMAGIELLASAKLDGNKGRSMYAKENDLYVFKHGITKARAETAEPVVITRNISRLIPKSFPALDIDPLVIDGEIFVLEGGVDVINAKYDLKLVTARSAGLSMIRNNIYSDLDYSYCTFVAHGINYGSTLLEGYELLEDLGFPTPPHMLIIYEHMPFAGFEMWLRDLMRKIKQESDDLHYPTDGLVIEINDREEMLKTRSEGLYDSGNFAAKVYEWEAGVYTSKVKEILVQQQAERFTFKAYIEPTKTASGVVISVVDLFNLGNVIENDIIEGDKIRFQYKNETTPVFICKVTDDE